MRINLRDAFQKNEVFLHQMQKTRDANMKAETRREGGRKRDKWESGRKSNQEEGRDEGGKKEEQEANSQCEIGR